MLKYWIKQRFSNLPDILLAAFLSSILATGSVSLFYKNLWLYLKNKLLSPTPLWATISLVFLVLVCLKTINTRSYKVLDNTKNSNLTPYFGVYWDENLNIYCPACKSLLNIKGNIGRDMITCLKCNQSCTISNGDRKLPLKEARELIKKKNI